MSRFFRGNGMMVVMFIVLAASMILQGDVLSHPLQWLIWKLFIIPGIIIGITVHEFAHAIAAYKLGDPTPKIQKRVTLNPLAHIEPIGLIALLLIGFGWGKPVQVNPYAFRRERLYNFITDIAGVVTNFIMAILFTGIYRIVENALLHMTFAGNHTQYYIMYYLCIVIQCVIYMNLVLMIFNLLPVPPLDGFGIITELFDLRRKPIYHQIYNAGFPILIVLIMLQVPARVIAPVIRFFYHLLANIFGISGVFDMFL
ncbi:MAG: site-2 protease family protein [Clostridiales Family XIII bacterium]|jgi:Zn-dependent protease|nr:site-2 protease family protein [Clostridiales Family XIII bacterium]